MNFTYDAITQGMTDAQQLLVRNALIFFNRGVDYDNLPESKEGATVIQFEANMGDPIVETRSEQEAEKIKLDRRARFRDIGQDAPLGDALIAAAQKYISEYTPQDFLITLFATRLVDSYNFLDFVVHDRSTEDHSFDMLQKKPQVAQGTWQVFYENKSDIEKEFPKIWPDISQKLDRDWEKIKIEKNDQSTDTSEVKPLPAPSECDETFMKEILEELTQERERYENVVDFPGPHKR